MFSYLSIKKKKSYGIALLFSVVNEKPLYYQRNA